MEEFSYADSYRISRNPEVMGGKPCVRGMRVTVGMIVGLVASGHSNAEIIAAYPYLEEDIGQVQNRIRLLLM